MEFVEELTDIEASFKFLSPTPTRVVWHQDQAGFVPNSCPGSAHYYGSETASSYGGSDADHGGAGAETEDSSRYRDQVSTGVHHVCVPCAPVNCGHRGEVESSCGNCIISVSR